MKKMEKQTFQFKLSNWRHNVKINESWIPFGSIEYKGYPLTAQAPSLEDLHKVLPGCTYPNSRDSYWHLFGPHSGGDQGEGDDVEISIELNVPKNMKPIITEDANQQCCECNCNLTGINCTDFSCWNDSVISTNNDTTTFTIQFKIEDGTTYFLDADYPYASNKWLLCTDAKGPGTPVVPAVIDVIQALSLFFTRFEYHGGMDSANTAFAEHQGNNNLGDAQPFNVVFTCPVDTIEADIYWKIFRDEDFPCTKFKGAELGRYFICTEEKPDGIPVVCVNYAIPANHSFYWVYPPFNEQMDNKKWDSISTIAFKDDQYTNACPIFWSHSGSCLGGDNVKFSVKMTQTTVGF